MLSVVGEMIPFDDGHGSEVLAQNVCGKQSSHATTENQGVPTRILPSFIHNKSPFQIIAVPHRSL